jgi:anion-transporting  ArsA/GET3 family ATPase
MAQVGELDRLLAVHEIVLVCGPGGVGKTTTAAALALGAAMREQRRVLVLTIDPARRLADALGIELGSDPRRVDLSGFGLDDEPRGELFAAMLDPPRHWDDLVRRLAPSVTDAKEILANPIYQNLTRRFALSQDYIAMERLYALEHAGEWDLLVIDTPPSQNALDFLDAPTRLGELFSSSLLRFLVAPRRTRLIDLASRPVYQIADRLLGTQVLGDLSRFLVLFNTMHAELVEHAEAVASLVRSPQTTFAVVATLETEPVADARRLSVELQRRALDVGLVVANRTLPPAFADDRLVRVARTLHADPVALAEALAGTVVGAPADVARVLEEVGASVENYRLVAQREAELFAALARDFATVVRVPHLGPVSGAEMVTEFARLLHGEEPG